MSTIRFVVALLLSTAFMPTAHATIPSILGTFTGNASSTETGCTNPADDESGTNPITITVDNQSAGSFTGSGSEIDGDGTTFNFSGTVSASGAVSGSVSGSDSGGGQFSATFSGTLSGDTLTYTFNGSDTAGCTINGNATVVRSGAVDPESTASSTVISSTEITTATRALVGVLSTRIGGFLRGRGTGANRIANGFMLQGMSAGDGFDVPKGVWASYSRTDSEDDFASTAFDSDRNMAMAGFDYSPRENVIFGIAVGYEDNEVDTTFNRGQQDATGFTIAPYAGAIFNETFSGDISLGYSRIDIDQFRILPGTATRVTSSTDSNRFFVSGNVAATRQFDKLLGSGRVGLVWAKDAQDAFTESNGRAVGDNDFKIFQLRVGGEISYLAGSFEPFASAFYERDLSRTETTFAAGVAVPKDDRDDVLVNLGVRYFGDNGLSGTLDYAKVLGRANFDEHSINLLLRLDF